MPFGLTNASATFQALMNDTLRPFLRRFVLVFFLTISSSTGRPGRSISATSTWCWPSYRSITYCSTLQMFIRRMLGGVPGACCLGRAEGSGRAGLVATTLHARIRAFLGLVGYYHRFIKNNGAIATPLTALFKKDVFKWSAEVEEAFWALQRALTSAPILQLSDFDRDFVVECDASGMGLGVVLHHGGGPIAFFSRQLVPHIPSSPLTSGNSSGWSKQCGTGSRTYGDVRSSSRPITSV
jgi:hypothetical protein